MLIKYGVGSAKKNRIPKKQILITYHLIGMIVAQLVAGVSLYPFTAWLI